MIGYIEAQDEMFSLLKVAMDANSVAILGYDLEIRWPGVSVPSVPDGSKSWLRVSRQSVLAQQKSLSTEVSGPGKRRYQDDGLIIVQLFGAKSESASNTKLQQLAVVARNAYRGKSTAGCVWFRNVRIQELKDEALYYRFNVVAEYEYDEIA